ncbi:MAG: hypothetical protein HGA65_19300 [Oscillochloris sp.]|nr:hypothetical protein [Oscillochloris sp.]
MQLDTVHSQVVFTGAQAGSAYNLEIMRVSAAGEQRFAHQDVTIAGTDTHYMSYGTWDGIGSMTVQIDHGSNGTIDSTVTLLNEHKVYLPMIPR